MPENLKIGAFVFGAILVLIAILGGNFRLFGADVASTVSNPLLRFMAFALGAIFLVVAMHPSVNLPDSTSVNAAYKNGSTGLCLDSNTEGKVYTMGCNGGNFQNWKRSGQSLVNVSTGLCLDSNTEGKVYTMSCNGGNFQNWN
jgi:hypothetical protein